MLCCLADKVVTPQEDNIVNTTCGEEAQVSNIHITDLAEELSLLQGSLGLAR